MQLSRHPGRKGYSLREMLIATGLLGILFALLLPAIQDVRETARREQCLNNMKQLGIACHKYHDVWKSLPFMRGGTISPGGYQDPLANEICMSGRVSLLPFLDNQATFDQAARDNFGPVPWKSSKHWDVQIPDLRCPSDGYAAGGRGDANYCFVIGTDVIDNHTFLGEPANGMFGCVGISRNRPNQDLGKTVNFGEVHDGLSNTLMLGERRNAYGHPTYDLAWVASNVTSVRTNEVMDAYDACWKTANDFDGNRYNDRRAIARGTPGTRYADGRPYYSGITTIIPPNGPSCTIDDGDWQQGVFTMSSRHPSLAVGVFGDGSVRTISDHVDIVTWWAAGTRAGQDDITMILSE